MRKKKKVRYETAKCKISRSLLYCKKWLPNLSLLVTVERNIITNFEAKTLRIFHFTVILTTSRLRLTLTILIKLCCSFCGTSHSPPSITKAGNPTDFIFLISLLR